MKKLFTRAAVLLSLFTVAACSEDAIVENMPSSIKSEFVQEVSITGSDFQFDGDTRSSVVIKESGASFLWNANDTVGIFPNKGGQVEFAMSEGAGTQTATFSGGGWALKSSATYAAYYPYNFYNRNLAKIPVSYVGQTQNGNNNTDHIGTYDFMAASVSTPSNGNVAFDMQHLGCLVQFVVTIPESSTLKKLVLNCPSKFTKTGTIDLTAKTPAIVAKELSDAIEIALTDVATTKSNEKVIIYFMTAPVDLSDNKLTATIHFADGTVREAEIVGKNLQAGKAYQLTAEIETIPNNQIWYTSSDGEIITPNDGGSSFGHGVSMISNTYKNGKGVMIFSGDIQWISGGSSFPLRAFSGCKTLTSIIIPESVDGIESFAFYECTSLKKITLPSKLRRIGGKAFSGCTSLRSISLPENLLVVENQAFYGCSSLEAITLPNSRQFSVGSMAFGLCSSLKELFISDNVYHIGDGAFAGCNLKSISVSTNNNYFTSNNNILYDKNKTKLILAAQNCNSIEIPTTVTEICNAAFYGCSMTKISIPNTIISIGEEAFRDCNLLESITLPNLLTEIKSYTFYGCSTIKKITIPDKVKTINSSAFSNCKSLTEVILPNNLEIICGTAFSGCSSLCTISLPNKLYTIGNYAFQGCTSLTNISIPNNYISIINEGTFSKCTSLANITIPETISEIGNYAFEQCYNLSNVFCKANTPPLLGNSAFDSTSKNLTVYVPTNAENEYKTDSKWNLFNIQSYNYDN